jgi:hypothetical protein
MEMTKIQQRKLMFEFYFGNKTKIIKTLLNIAYLIIGLTFIYISIYYIRELRTSKLVAINSLIYYGIKNNKLSNLNGYTECMKTLFLCISWNFSDKITDILFEQTKHLVNDFTRSSGCYTDFGFKNTMITKALNIFEAFYGTSQINSCFLNVMSEEITKKSLVMMNWYKEINLSVYKIVNIPFLLLSGIRFLYFGLNYFSNLFFGIRKVLKIHTPQNVTAQSRKSK